MPIKINILQPSFAPWIGVFEQIINVDIHCFMVDVSATTKTNFRRTKLVKLLNEDIFDNYSWFNSYIGKASYKKIISKFKVSDFQNNIPIMIKYFYDNRDHYPYCDDVLNILSNIKDYEFIYEVNIHIIKEVCNYFEFKDKKFIILNNDDCYYKKNLDKSDYLLSIIKKYGANEYVTGHGAYNYIDYLKFNKNGINLRFMDYKNNNYNLKNQNNFVPYVSILDLIGKRGKSGKSFINSRTI